MCTFKKCIAAIKILPIWHNEGHKVLLFSQTQSMLNIVEQMIKQLNFKYLRLDGSTSVGKRDGLIKQFNDRDGGVFTMLLTTRAGKTATKSDLGTNCCNLNCLIYTRRAWHLSYRCQPGHPAGPRLEPADRYSSPRARMADWTATGGDRLQADY